MIKFYKVLQDCRGLVRILVQYTHYLYLRNVRKSVFRVGVLYDSETKIDIIQKYCIGTREIRLTWTDTKS